MFPVKLGNRGFKMLIESLTRTEIFGLVKIHGLQRVLKLESKGVKSNALQGINKEQIEDILDNFAIVIPIKDEKLNLLDGVLKAIPDNCQIIVVSNSSRDNADTFKMERGLIKNFYTLTGHPVIIIHQKDPGAGLAFKEAGYDSILDSKGFVRDGKGEGMILGILISKWLGKKYVGFIDSDNYIPGAVNEYIKDYAAGFYMSESPYSMIRLHWRHKPKIVKSRLYFRKWGRVSEITNRYLNMLLATLTGFETDLIKTGNAGEHAMTMELAEVMAHSTGYSVEPYQLIYLMEEFGKGDTQHVEVANKWIEIFQIETLNPHLHEEKGEKHISGMLVDSLSTVYHSSLANDYIKSEIIRELESKGIEKVLEKNIIMPPIKDVNVKKFGKVLEENAETLARFE